GFWWNEHLARLDLLARDETALEHQRLQAREPDLVVGLAEVVFGRPVLAGEARHVDIPAAGARHCDRERAGALFPFVMEHRLVRFRLDRTETGNAAHVMRAIHQEAPGCFGNPVPIMLSRVTSSASCSSLQPSVPFGRIGSTR